MEVQKFIAVVDNFKGNLWGHHIRIPAKISNYFLSTETRRLVCMVPNGESFSCALMSRGEGDYFIHLNKDRLRRLNVSVGSKIEVTLKIDESTCGMPMPVEMEELMHLDEEGKNYFHALTPGKQRSLLYLIGKAKKTETRLRKAWTVLEYLKVNQGKMDFRTLNEAFKENKDLNI